MHMRAGGANHIGATDPQQTQTSDARRRPLDKAVFNRSRRLPADQQPAIASRARLDKRAVRHHRPAGQSVPSADRSTKCPSPGARDRAPIKRLDQWHDGLTPQISAPIVTPLESLIRPYPGGAKDRRDQRPVERRSKTDAQWRVQPSAQDRADDGARQGIIARRPWTNVCPRPLPTTSSS
uniref:Uncharacterized protein n=1 Tax=Plectus sambesii TaxID=2011161 RepID=A0A914XRR1_9BILA